jgi:hypothetical protein
MAVQEITKGVNVAQSEIPFKVVKPCQTCRNHLTDLCGPCLAQNGKNFFEPKEAVILPRFTICQMCRNNMTDLCEPCMLPTGRHWFEPTKYMTIDEARPFPVEEVCSREMPNKHKAVTYSFYMSLLVARQQGLK